MQRPSFPLALVEPHSTQAGILFFDIRASRIRFPGRALFSYGTSQSKGEDLYYFR